MVDMAELNPDADIVSSAQRIASQGDKASALKFLRQRQVPSEFGGLGAAQIQAWADINFVAGQTKVAERFYLHATEQHPEFFWSYFQLGRLAQAAGDLKRAVAMHSRAAELMPAFAWASYELTQCYIALEDAAKVAAALRQFLDADEVGLNETHLRAIKTAAHFVYERQHREIGWDVYDFLENKGVRDSLSYTRRAERFLAQSKFEEAIAFLEKWPKDIAPNDWGLRGLATAYSAVDRLEDAERTLAGIVQRNPANHHFLRDYIVVLAKQGKAVEAARILSDRAERLPPEVLADLSIVHLVYAREYARLCDELEVGALRPSPAVGNEILHAIFALGYVEKEYALARRLIVMYTAIFGDTIDIKLCKLNIAFAMQVWEDGDKVLAGCSAEEFEQSLPLRVKRFEYYCFTGDLKKAATALTALEPVAELPAEFIAPVLRFYAEKAEWRKLYELAMSRLPDGFDYKQTGYIVFRAIRKTKSHISAITEIERIDGWENSSSLRQLRTIIMEDMVHNDSMLEELLHDPYISESDALQHRLFFKMRVLRGEQEEIFSRDYAIYFCTNEGYLCATLVAITSMVENNAELMEDVSIFVVVEDSLVDYATPLVMELGAGLEVAITVLGAGAIIPKGTRFNGGYGMFTGGHSLADAAYYRIYAARHLLGLGKFKRGLYIDSDTIVRSGLEKLFWMKSRLPLMARPEDTRPEVVIASRAHGLELGTYFNSGVLYIDFTNRHAAAALDGTIGAIVNPETKLYFQDQCALNIGFKRNYEPLRTSYNYFVKSDGDGDIGDAVVIHFIDRPKPWDPAYPGAICRLWYSYWRRLSRHIGSKAALELYRNANKG